MILIHFQTKSIVTTLSNTPLITTKMIPQFLNALTVLFLKKIGQGFFFSIFFICLWHYDVLINIKF